MCPLSWATGWWTPSCLPGIPESSRSPLCKEGCADRGHGFPAFPMWPKIERFPFGNLECMRPWAKTQSLFFSLRIGKGQLFHSARLSFKVQEINKCRCAFEKGHKKEKLSVCFWSLFCVCICIVFLFLLKCRWKLATLFFSLFYAD